MKAFLGTGHLGAKACDRAEDAVAGAEVVHLTLKDDDTVDEVLAMALPGLQPGAVIVDHTTTSVQGAIDRTKAWKERGYTYLHAPVFMGPQNALESTGYMLVSGDQELISRMEPALTRMTGKLINFGTEPGKAAGMKLIGNLFLIAFTGGMTDMLSLAKTLNISTAEVATLLDAWNPGAAAPARLKKMTSGTFDQPTWELHMARKDAGLMIQEAMKGGAKLTVIPAVAAEMDHWIEKGHANDDWTVIAKDVVS